MKILLFGATGMVGQGVLRECLLDPAITDVLAIGRSPTSLTHPKLREIKHKDYLDFSGLEDLVTGFDACFFCLGVTSAGMNEADYTRATYGFTMAAAGMFAKVNPGKVFIYVSGAGADSTERGRVMWARVRGKTENDVLRMPLDAYVFRPAAIRPLHGITSRTRWYRLLYRIGAPLFPLLRAIAPNFVTTTEQFGRAMIQVAGSGAGKRLLESGDINRISPV